MERCSASHAGDVLWTHPKRFCLGDDSLPPGQSMIFEVYGDIRVGVNMAGVEARKKGYRVKPPVSSTDVQVAVLFIPGIRVVLHPEPAARSSRNNSMNDRDA